jgi:excisionase family DNA binding protein
MPPDTTPRPLMNLAEVAERLGVNQRHVRRLVAERRIPYLKWATGSASTPTNSRRASTALVRGESRGASHSMTLKTTTDTPPAGSPTGPSPSIWTRDVGWPAGSSRRGQQRQPTRPRRLAVWAPRRRNRDTSFRVPSGNNVRLA